MAGVGACGARSRRVSAQRSWPHGCGRFPAVPGVVAAAFHPAVSSAACNGGLPRARPKPQPESAVEEGDKMNEGGEAQAPGNVDVRTWDGQVESRALPPAYAALQSCAVAAANASMENGGFVADSFLLDRKGGRESSQFVADVEVIGGRYRREMRSRAGDGKLVRIDHGGREKRWLMSVVNPPPKRREVSAMRRFPRGCWRAAAIGAGIGGDDGYVSEATPISFELDWESGQSVRDLEVISGDDGRETGSRKGDGELTRKEDGAKKKRWLTSTVNLPPKRRAVSAMRRFPLGCGRPAVSSTGIGGEEGLVSEATPISFATNHASVVDALPTVPTSCHGASLML